MGAPTDPLPLAAAETEPFPLAAILHSVAISEH